MSKVAEPLGNEPAKQKRNRGELAGLLAGGMGGKAPTTASALKKGEKESSSGDWGAVFHAGILVHDDETTSPPRRRMRSRSSGRAASAPLPAQNPPDLAPPPLSPQPAAGVAHTPVAARPAVAATPAATPRAPADPFEHGMGKGSRIMDLELVQQELRQHTCCKMCAKAKQKQVLLEFAEYYEALMAAAIEAAAAGESVERFEPADMVHSFISSRHGSGVSLGNVPSHELVDEKVCGAASTLHFKCPGLSMRSQLSPEAPASGNRHRFRLDTSVKVRAEGRLTPTARWAVNQRLALAALQSGMQAGDFHTILALLGVPVKKSFAFKGKGWRGAERAIGACIEDVAEESCFEALRDEIEQTIAAKLKLELEMKQAEEEAAKTARLFVDVGLESGSEEEGEAAGAAPMDGESEDSEWRSSAGSRDGSGGSDGGSDDGSSSSSSSSGSGRSSSSGGRGGRANGEVHFDGNFGFWPA